MMKEDFSFLNETIKKEPFYKKKPMKMIAATIGLAVLFGAVSCVTFLGLYDRLGSKDEQKQAEDIRIPQDAENEASGDSSEDAAQTVTPEPVVQEVTVEDYEKIYDGLRDIFEEAQKSLVTVTTVSNDVDWFNAAYENYKMASGTIIGDNGVELLILTDYEAVASKDDIHVSFCDETTADAVVKKYDATTQLAIISVNLSDISGTTRGQIKETKLGNSRLMKEGMPVIALGMADGSPDSVKYGMLTSVDNTVNAVDGRYTLLMTDMERNAGAGGVLINLDGEIIGLIQDTYGAEYTRNCLTAYHISEMKSLIEHLSNNQDVAYLGIRGTAVTDQIAQANEIPKGIYVIEVMMDSPAMVGGIQSGDIIQKINGQQIDTMSDLSSVLDKLADRQSITLEGMRQTKDGYKKIEYQTDLQVLE